MNYFVTGTDTGVGKTLITCALLHAFADQGQRVIGMKPVAAGCDSTEVKPENLSGDNSVVGARFIGRLSMNNRPMNRAPTINKQANGVSEINDDVKKLLACSNFTASPEQVNPYCFPQFMAPHIAAKNAGVRIEFAPILAAYRELAAQADVVIVEGVGGFRVPLNELQDSADLALQLALPVILVVGMRLGCLNHALLTIRAITDCGLTCAGWVANVLDDEMPALSENIEALQQRIAEPLLGVVPHQPHPDARIAARHLNLELLPLNAENR